MSSAINKLQDGTIELTINIPWRRIQQAYDKNIEMVAKEANIKGFRKGKAPKKVVEKNIDKQTVYQEVLKSLITDLYVETIKEHQLKPIVNPQINVTSMEDGKDWQVKAVTCEFPKIELGDYKQAVKKELAADKIWVPGKDKEDKEKKPDSENQKLDKIFKALLENVKFSIPTILLQEEVNRMLSRLIEQTSKLGLTVEQYLTSIGKNSDQIKEEYQQQAEQTLKLELILSAIADEQKIQVTDQEVQKMIDAIPEENSRKAFEKEEQKIYIRQLLRKRQAIDNLSKL